jgi:hypothetical protein
VKLFVATSLAGILFLGGCWKPSVQSGGFRCNPADSPACPSGLFCVAGYCVDHADGGPGIGGTGPGPDLATTGGGGNADMNTGNGADLSGGPPDFSMMPPDLSQPPACGMNMAPCLKPSDCCSNLCTILLGCV